MAIFGALAAAMIGCATEDDGRIVPVDLEPTTFEQIDGWQQDRHAEALPALARSCAVRLKRRARIGDAEPRFGAPADWRAVCLAARSLADGDDEAARAFFERNFRPYRVSGTEGGEGLITGYYEPELIGAREAGPAVKTPLYARPPDLVSVRLADFRSDLTGRLTGRVEKGRLKPYYSRAEIVDGALGGKGLEIAWVADPVEAFFLQIQGSGRVKMPDGTMLRLGYAAANGHPYTAIGRVLIANGALEREKVSLQSIREWLRTNPDKMREILDANASYVFFRELAGEGPVGSQGVALTPGRSLAVDRRYLPLGLPMWVETVDPLDTERPLRRLVVAQDTGGAIRGAVRADIFWGAGAEAEERAGRMRSPGRYYVLLPVAQGGRTAQTSPANIDTASTAARK